ncbi:hypothetical protein LTR85_004327 [Meristemomyces frigidus]|nr:hypothetical protein LTR85_004327 [Meristemomyces frigidus]
MDFSDSDSDIGQPPVIIPAYDDPEWLDRLFIALDAMEGPRPSIGVDRGDEALITTEATPDLQDDLGIFGYETTVAASASAPLTCCDSVCQRMPTSLTSCLAVIDGYFDAATVDAVSPLAHGTVSQLVAVGQATQLCAPVPATSTPAITPGVVAASHPVSVAAVPAQHGIVVCLDINSIPSGRQRAKILRCGVVGCTSTALFGRKYELKRHMEGHQSSYACSIPGCTRGVAKPLKRADKLAEHMRRAHGH